MRNSNCTKSNYTSDNSIGGSAGSQWCRMCLILNNNNINAKKIKIIQTYWDPSNDRGLKNMEAMWDNFSVYCAIMFTALPKRLAAFDFDYTIVDDNTDTVIRGLLPASEVVKYSCTDFKCWTYYMQDIFNKLYQRNVSDLDITNEIIKIQPVSGMKTLIKKLKDELNFDIIIISDSNTLFIDKWLRNVGLKDYILQVFSNPAQFVEQQLQIQPYHEQTDCKLSPYNMCKYRILDEFLQSQKRNNITYSAIYYFGDGSNDFCPISQLSTNDIGCVRFGYKCLDMLQKCILNQPPKNVFENHIRSEIFIWHDGHELLKFISEKVK